MAFFFTSMFSNLNSNRSRKFFGSNQKHDKIFPFCSNRSSNKLGKTHQSTNKNVPFLETNSSLVKTLFQVRFDSLLVAASTHGRLRLTVLSEFPVTCYVGVFLKVDSGNKHVFESAHPFFSPVTKFEKSEYSIYFQISTLIHIYAPVIDWLCLSSLSLAILSGLLSNTFNKRLIFATQGVSPVGF